MTYPPQQPPYPPQQPPPYPPQQPGYGYQPPFSGHPVQLSIQRAEHQSRALALFSIPFFFIRFIALIPALIVLYFVTIAFEFVAWIAQWAVLFNGRYPEGMHRFGTGVLRWQIRVTAFAFGLTDSYPPFNTQP